MSSAEIDWTEVDASGTPDDTLRKRPGRDRIRRADKPVSRSFP